MDENVLTHAASLVETVRAQDEPVAAGILFPSLNGLLALAPLRPVSSCALLRLADGTIWFLRAIGEGWTTRRLSLAANVIQGAAESGLRNTRLAGRVARAVDMPGLAILDPLLDHADRAQWDTRHTAEALLDRYGERRLFGAAVQDVETRIRNIEDTVVTTLDEALAAFVAGLDPEVRTAARDDNGFDASAFNYLHREPLRKYRMQFAATFPILLRSVARAVPGSVDAEIRLAVDAGIPLIEGLAARWDVSQGALRCLVGRAPELVGVQWESNVRELATILDALRPEDRPGKDPAAWRNFNIAVAVAERVFRRRVWASPHALAWLREVVRPGRGGRYDNDEGSLPQAEVIAAIDRLRDAVVRAVLIEAQGAAWSNDPAAVKSAEQVFDKWLATKPPGRLAKHAERFDREYAQARSALALESRVLAGDSFWPLLPEDMVSSDGQRRITSLVSRHALVHQGNFLNQCIARSHLETYANRCMRGESFLISMTDPRTNLRCSTAEIGVVRSLGGRHFELTVRQHTGIDNTPPSEACGRAMTELQALSQSESFQAHLRNGFRVLRDRTRHDDAAAKNRADLLPLARALRGALGDRAYDELVLQARQALRTNTNSREVSGRA